MFFYLIVAYCACAVSGYEYFRDRIPNGHSVPHPCDSTQMWNGVGHETQEGGTPRNSFGLDWKANGASWGETICKMDSDGDGRTNGEELGDPGCTWTIGGTPSNTASSHPDVFNISISFAPNTTVPAQETTYMCQVFDLPEVATSGAYHLIAAVPNIVNPAIGCDDIIAIWAVGSTGLCLPDEIGFAVGVGGYTQVSFEIHWDNQLLLDSYVDNSGFTLFLTPNRRANNAGIFMIGQNALQIPPQQQAYSVSGRCSGSCADTIYADNHTEIKIAGAFDEAVTVSRRHELNVTCTFNTMSRTEVTYSGESTTEEMCYTFLLYYPKEALTERSRRQELLEYADKSGDVNTAVLIYGLFTRLESCKTEIANDRCRANWDKPDVSVAVSTYVTSVAAILTVAVAHFV
ncbi:TEMPT-like protein [Mya arenaria]|uniref:TEMPT-like protein n=1 Tax=Mya arenaria TaxID=6604 RepID=A0ABY7F981_MYAAR|nr:TEMPT-like protein [Mya arenaria]